MIDDEKDERYRSINTLNIALLLSLVALLSSQSHANSKRCITYQVYYLCTSTVLFVQCIILLD